MVHGPWSFTDTHCHLDLRQFDADRDAVIERAAAAGVTTIVNPAIDLASCRRALALAERYPSVYAAVGVHPNDCADFDADALAQLRELARHPKVVAIGEIGLDYYWNKVAVEQQRRALRAQLALAADLALPVILHSRSAQGDETRRCNSDLLGEVAKGFAGVGADQDGMVSEAGQSSVQRPASSVGVWHAFSGDLAQAQVAYDLGLALGLGGPVTFQNARRLQVLMPALRLDRLVLETDAPYLAPHPHRGQRNEPAYVPLIAQALATQLGTTVAAVAARTVEMAALCFRVGKA